MAPRRQANIRGGRSVEHRVTVDPETEAVLAAHASARGVTIPKLLVDCAINAPVVNKRAVLLELGGLRRRLEELRPSLGDDQTFVEIEAHTTALGNAVFLT